MAKPVPLLPPLRPPPYVHMAQYMPDKSRDAAIICNDPSIAYHLKPLLVHRLLKRPGTITDFTPVIE